MQTPQLTYVMDVDGTLCPIKRADEHYEDLVPYPEMVKKLQQVKKQGAKIVIYTSRNMNTYRGNLGAINMHTAPVMLEWLKKWDIPCDEIVFGKVWPGHRGFYVDDRAVRPDEFLKYDADELDAICNNFRFRTAKEEKI